MTSSEQAGGWLIVEDTDLTSLEGLHRLRVVYGTVSISGNHELDDLFGLRSLERVRSLNISDNDKLRDLRGLDSLTDVYGVCGYKSANTSDFSIRDNEQLESLEGLESLRNGASGLTIAANPSLEDLSALSPNLTLGRCHAYRIGLVLRNNESLDDLGGLYLPNVSSFQIISNPNLTDLSGLSYLEEAEVLTIAGNDALTDLHGLHNLRRVDSSWEIGTTGRKGGLYIEHNDRLHSLDALSSLGSIQGSAGDIHVAANPLLTDLSGLEGVSNAGAVVVAENAALESLDGLENLKHLDDRLALEENTTLQNADALLGIDSLSQLRVTNNPALPSCYADAIAAAVEDGGYVTIEGNGDGDCP